MFDTNVLLSAILFGGKPGACLSLARRAAITGLTCREILDEVAAVLQRNLDFGRAEANAVVGDLLTFLGAVTIQRAVRGVSADPGNDKVIERALAGNATHVVTGDRRHLLLGSYEGIAIVSPSDLLSALQV